MFAYAFIENHIDKVEHYKGDLEHKIDEFKCNFVDV